MGQVSGAPTLSPDAVNVPMIRHWVEAMGDENPVYVSDETAREAGFAERIAPPTMLQAWIMRGLRASILVEEARAAGTAQGAGPNDKMMELLDDEGLTSVVATNCEQEYGRPLVVGDRVLARSTIESISDPKRTGLGTGRFLTTRMDYVAVPDTDVPSADAVTPEVVQALFDAGEPVATMRFRILKYLPPERTPARPPRPRPAITQDNAFWFEGARAHRLLIQHCTSCGTLRHPPLPACGVCGSLDWDTVESSGRGTVYSYVVVHYPQVPAFEYPLPIGLVELEEGTRVVANLGGVEPEDVTVGMAVRAEFVDFDEELSLPVFVPGGCGGGRLMDFTFSEEQLAVSEAAAGIFSGRLVEPERIVAIESGVERIDRELWQALAGADLLGLAVPEAYGGAGQGLMELCLLLEAQGNAVAPVPLWATLVLGALPIAHFGSEAQRATWLPRVVSGEVVLTAALNGAVASPASVPAVRATASSDGGWVLEGTEFAVPHAHAAARVVVAAQADDGVLLALVDPQGAGVSLERTVTTNREIHPHLTLAGVTVAPGDVLVGPDLGRSALDFVLVAATIGLCALQTGRVRGGVDPHRGVPEHAPPVRPAAQHLPGHDAQGSGCRHRHRGDARDVAERRLALRHRTRCRRRSTGRQVAGVGARATHGPYDPAPARRHGCGHLVPHSPLLPLGQADRAHARWPERAAGAGWVPRSPSRHWPWRRRRSDGRRRGGGSRRSGRGPDLRAGLGRRRAAHARPADHQDPDRLGRHRQP